MKDVDPDAMTALVKYMYDGEFEHMLLKYRNVKFLGGLTALV